MRKCLPLNTLKLTGAKTRLLKKSPIQCACPILMLVSLGGLHFLMGNVGDCWGKVWFEA